MIASYADLAGAIPSGGAQLDSSVDPPVAEALLQCHNLIVLLSGGDLGKVNKALAALGYPVINPSEFKFGALPFCHVSDE